MYDLTHDVIIPTIENGEDLCNRCSFFSSGFAVNNRNGSSNISF